MAETRLTDLPPYELAAEMLARARAAVHEDVGLYAIDLGGTRLVRIAGPERLPREIPVGQHLSAEVHRDCVEPVRRSVAATVPGYALVPLWTGDSATASLVVPDGAEPRVRGLAAEGGPAIELAARLTDVFQAARRARPTTPAAELQAAMLPPRTNRFPGAALAANILPAYDVGGDWFDHAHTPRAGRFSVADAAGKGPAAMAVASLTLSALRAARRSGKGLSDSAAACHAAVLAVGGPMSYVTGVIARWDPDTSRIAWVNCGHPPPLLWRDDGRIDELWNVRNMPFGLDDEQRSFEMEEVALHRGDRFVLYSDGITERATRSGERIGLEGLCSALRRAQGAPAPVVVSRVMSTVAAAGEPDVRDDATLLVFAAL